jgi:hypothetical protein
VNVLGEERPVLGEGLNRMNGEGGGQSLRQERVVADSAADVEVAAVGRKLADEFDEDVFLRGLVDVPLRYRSRWAGMRWLS